MRSYFPIVAFLLACPPAIEAQRPTPSFDDLILVRNRPYADDTLLELRLGAVAGFPNQDAPLRQAEGRVAPDGYVYYRQQHAFGRKNRFEVYVGRDGAYAGLTEGDPSVDRGYTRLELFGRQWANYIREGYYDGDDFKPVGIYDARDWKARLGFATKISESIRGEVIGFFGMNDFKSNDRTDPAFTPPQDHSVYGAQIILEDNTAQIDRKTGLIYQGYILTAWVQGEWNTTDESFGILGRISTLPDQVIRGGGHLEWYFPHTNEGTLIVSADVGISPEGDRIVHYEPTHPLGEWWGDATVEYRLLLGSIFTITPGVRLQYSRIYDQFATERIDKIFYGGHLRVRADVIEHAAIELEYSYLSNQSRRPIGFDRDTIGEHRVWIGTVVSL